jgi:hypothetical protein
LAFQQQIYCIYWSPQNGRPSAAMALDRAEEIT